MDSINTKKIGNDEIITQIRNLEKLTFTAQELSQKTKWNYFLVLKILKDLVTEGILKETALNTFSIQKPDSVKPETRTDLQLGTISIHEKGFGFINCDDGNKYFVPPNKINFAIDGDVVKFSLEKDELKDGFLANVESIISRKNNFIVGLVKEDRKIRNNLVFIPDSKSVNYKIVIKNKETLIPNHKVVLKVLQVTSNKELLCDIYKDLGDMNDKFVDIYSIVYANDIPVDFTEESLNYCRNLKFDTNEIKNRVDLTNKMIVTIDGDDSKDFDDSICVEAIENNRWRVYVSIADVSHYVLEQTSLDFEALSRGTSVYLIDVVVPMLPNELSNDLCSLNEHTEKLTLTAEMIIDEKGNVEDYKIYKSFIISKHRLTYKEVNKYYSEKINPKNDEELAKMLDTAYDCYKALAKNKEDKGMINFENEEPKLILNDEGKTVDVHFHERGESEKLIEQLMIIANETVALFLERTKGITPIFRIHNAPQTKKIETFIKLGKLFGFATDESKEITNKYIQSIVNNNKDSSQKYVINLCLLKSLEKAKYFYKNEGHFGLASECYTHFTSPIRRYPDLIVHRLLTAILDNKIENNFSTDLRIMEEICEESNTSEIRAVNCEREVIKVKKAEYMQKFVGEEFEGIITGINKFGFFVEIHDAIEGLVHISTLRDDSYVFDADKFTLVGEEKKREFKIGDRLKIMVASVIKFQGKIDFILPEFKNDEANREKFERSGFSRGSSNFSRPRFGGGNRSFGDRKPFRSNNFKSSGNFRSRDGFERKDRFENKEGYSNSGFKSNRNSEGSSDFKSFDRPKRDFSSSRFDRQDRPKRDFSSSRFEKRERSNGFDRQDRPNRDFSSSRFEKRERPNNFDRSERPNNFDRPKRFNDDFSNARFGDDDRNKRRSDNFGGFEKRDSFRRNNDFKKSNDFRKNNDFKRNNSRNNSGFKKRFDKKD